MPDPQSDAQYLLNSGMIQQLVEAGKLPPEFMADVQMIAADNSTGPTDAEIEKQYSNKKTSDFIADTQSKYLAPFKAEQESWNARQKQYETEESKRIAIQALQAIADQNKKREELNQPLKPTPKEMLIKAGIEIPEDKKSEQPQEKQPPVKSALSMEDELMALAHYDDMAIEARKQGKMPPSVPGIEELRQKYTNMAGMGESSGPSAEASPLPPKEFGGVLGRTGQPALDNYLEKATDQMNLISDLADQKAQTILDSQAKVEQAETASLGRSQAIEDRYASALSTLESAVADRATDNIDPERYWKNKSSFGKVAAIVSMGLGAYQASRYGGTNTALEQIDKEIQRDIEAQKYSQQDKDRKVQGQQYLLNAYTQALQNERAAAAATEETLWGAVKRQTELMTAQTGSLQAQTKLAELYQGIEQKQIEARTKATQELRRQAIEEVGQGEEEADQKLLEIISQEPDKEARKDYKSRYVQGYLLDNGALATTAEDATRLKKEVIPVYGQIASGTEELINMFSSDKPGEDYLEKRKRAQFLTQELIGNLRLPILGPGTIQEHERSIMESLIEDPTKITNLAFRNRAKAALETIKRRMTARYVGELNAAGIRAEKTPESVKSYLKPLPQ